MKLLVIEDEVDLRQIIAFMLESRFGADVFEAGSGNAGIEIIKQHPDLACVISDYRMEDGNGGKVFLYLQENHPNIPFIMASSDSPDDHREFDQKKPTAFFIKPFTASQLAAKVAELTGVEVSSAKSKLPAYCRIRASTVMKLESLNCDIYLRLSENKYVKVLAAGDRMQQGDVDKYDSKNIEYVYIKADETQSLLEKLTREISKDLLSTAAPRKLDASVLVTERAIEVIHELTHHLGFSPEVQGLTKASVDVALKSMRDDPQIAELLQKFAIDPDCYLASHSSALAYVACGLASSMTWNSESTRHKLAMAAFLHDVALEDNEMAKLADTRGPDALIDQYSEKQIEIFRHHAERAAELVRRMSEMPPDVDMILLNHHEKPDGSGFPFQWDHKRLSPLSSVFIIAHDLVVRMFNSPPPPNRDFARIVADMDKTYQTGHFKRIMTSIKTNLKSL